jgi:hypothetical protein
MRPARRALVALSFTFWGITNFSFAAGFEVQGSLESLTRHAIFLRLNDGRIVAALLHGLDPDALRGKYKLGDQIKLSCGKIAPAYVAEENFPPFVVEAKAIRYVRAPNPQELTMALASRASFNGLSLLERPQPDSGPETARNHTSSGVASLRAAAKSYISALPNYVADEKASIFTSAGTPQEWQPVRVLESEVTFTGASDSRDKLMVDGKPWARDFLEAPGPLPTGGFGQRLRELFADGCPITFELQRNIRSNSPLNVYTFVTPRDGCLGAQISGLYHYYPGYTGQVLYDQATKSVLEIQLQTTGFPKSLGVTLVEERIGWDFVNAGGANHLLPVSAERMTVEGNKAFLIKQEYKNYRHFEAAAKVTFH